MTELPAKPKRSIVTLIWLIVLQLMALVSLLFWVVVAGLPVMAFDTGQSPEVRTFVLRVWACSLFPLIWPSARGLRSRSARTGWQPYSPGRLSRRRFYFILSFGLKT